MTADAGVGIEALVRLAERNLAWCESAGVATESLGAAPHSDVDLWTALLLRSDATPALLPDSVHDQQRPLPSPFESSDPETDMAQAYHHFAETLRMEVGG